MIVPCHSVHVGVQETQVSEITISFVFKQSISQVKLEVSTRLVPQDVHVVVVPAHVAQLVFQATQVSPVTIVKPDSQVLLQVLVLRSNFILPFQDVQFVVVPDQKPQFESQGTHSPKVSFWI